MKRRGEPLANLYLFYGNENYLIEQRLKSFKSNNIEKIDGQSAEKAEIIQSLQGQSLFAQDKLVIIRHADLKDEKWDEIAPYLKTLIPQTILIIIAETAPARSKIVKLIEQEGEAVEFKSFAEWEEAEVIRWIKKQVESLGKSIEPRAAETLKEICGNDLQKLSSEIQKLITYIDKRGKIEDQDVLALASPGETSVFALADSLASKNAAETLKHFQVLAKNKTDIFGLLGLVAQQYRVLLFIKALPAHQRNAFQIAKQLGASPFFVKKCLSCIDLFKEAELKKNLEKVLDADLKLKSGYAHGPTLEALFVSLCDK